MGKVEYTGLLGALVIAVGALAGTCVKLYLAGERKNEQIQAMLREMLLHTEAVNTIPDALDRLRGEVLAKVERCPLLAGQFLPPRAT